MQTMRAMLLDAPHTPLHLVELPVPAPAAGQVLLKVSACGVCHTDLHILDGELTEPKTAFGAGSPDRRDGRAGRAAAHRFQVGERVGVPWLGATDGNLPVLSAWAGNLCDHPTFTGYHTDGGFAGYALADERFCFNLPASYTDVEVAPLLCAGLIGYRTYRMVGENVGNARIYGFGAAAHIVTQVANMLGKGFLLSPVQVIQMRRRSPFVRVLTGLGIPPGCHPKSWMRTDLRFGRSAGGIRTAGHPQGRVVVCGGIHMSDIPSFPYSLLWEERVIRSVANLTRRDGEEFLALAPQVPVKTDVKVFPARAGRSGALSSSATASSPARPVLDINLT